MWLESHNAVRHELTQEQSNNALEAYFRGDPPLREPKSRKDIPDSFIFQQIVDLKKQHGANLEVVVEDRALRSTCKGNSISCWDDLLTFIKSPGVQEFYSEKIISENNAEICKHVLARAAARHEEITSLLEEALLSDEFRILYGHNFRGEGDEKYVSGVDAPHHFDIEEMEYIGKRVFMATIRAEVELTYDFYLPRHDAINLDAGKYSASHVNDFFWGIETTDVFSFSARLELEFPESNGNSKTLEEVKSSLQEPELGVSDLTDFEMIDEME